MGQRSGRKILALGGGTRERSVFSIVRGPSALTRSAPFPCETLPHSCHRCLCFLVLEPQTDHAESCEIMAGHAESRP